MPSGVMVVSSAHVAPSVTAPTPTLPPSLRSGGGRTVALVATELHPPERSDGGRVGVGAATHSARRNSRSPCCRPHGQNRTKLGNGHNNGGPDMTMLKIGLAQARQTDSLERNAETILRFIDEAGTRGVRILCFPEGQTAGYRVDITRAEAPVEAASLDALHARVARRCGEFGMACILGTETPVAGARPYNSALVISPRGEILATHHKTKLTPMDALAYSPGSGFAVHE
ncbi:MAG: carbon-nitrogen hydrolase family protein, partial [Alphaproteobacteria bacterium]|nr:carbon-nitrogen hydrolase family protein [Alphaproteobacteria bacterium]